MEQDNLLLVYLTSNVSFASIFELINESLTTSFESEYYLYKKYDVVITLTVGQEWYS